MRAQRASAPLTAGEWGAAKPGATGLNDGSAPGGYPSAGASRVAGPLLVAAVLLQSACASLEGPDYAVQDPGEKFNRASFEFSEEVDRSFLVAGGADLPKGAAGSVGEGRLQLLC